MMRWALLAALLTQDSALRPQDPLVEKKNGRWQVRLSVQADVPDGTLVQIRVLPELFFYREGPRVIERAIPETLPPGRRARFQGGKSEVRIEVAGLRQVTLHYRIDPESQESVTVPSVLEARRSGVLLGTLAARAKSAQEDSDRPITLHRDLVKLLDKLEEAAQAPRALGVVVGLLNDLRAKCAKDLASGAYTATVGLLDTVASDAITYASWLVHRGAPAKGTAGAQGGGTDDPAALDDPTGGGKEGGGPAPEPGDGVNRGSGNIAAVTVELLRKRASVAPAVLRAEAILIFLHETKSLLLASMEGTKTDPVVLKSLEELLEVLLRKHGDSIPAEAKDSLRILRESRHDDYAGCLESLRRWEQAVARIP